MELSSIGVEKVNNEICQICLTTELMNHWSYLEGLKLENLISLKIIINIYKQMIKMAKEN